MIKLLKSTLSSTIEILQQTGLKQINQYSFEIDCAELIDYSQIKIHESDKFKALFDDLLKITGPVLYWFEIISEENNFKNVVDEFRNYKDGVHRTVPALKTKIDYDSKILYVGKVKRAFWGRLVQHLGFFTTDQTQGLQLYHWTRNLPLKLRINVFEFDNDMADLMPIIENAFAANLKPLIGKHI